MIFFNKLKEVNAGWKEKEWCLKNFIKLAEKFNNAYQVSIIIPFGQVDADVLAEIKNKQIYSFNCCCVKCFCRY